jgi:putative tricarboxylic transport membrane protein
VDQRKDLAVSVAVVVGGAALALVSQEISLGRIRDPLGSRALPTITGVLVMGLGLALVVRRVVQWDRVTNEVAPDGSEDLEGFPASTARAMTTWAGCFIYVALLPALGFLLATPVFIASLMVLLGIRRPPKVLAVSILATAILFLLFGEALNIRVPLGPLEPYVPL